MERTNHLGIYFCKKKSRILDLRQGSEYASGNPIFRRMWNLIILSKASEIDNVVNVTKWSE